MRSQIQDNRLIECASRRAVFEESFRQLKGKSAAEIRAPLSVKFRGEEGVDAGAHPSPRVHMPLVDMRAHT